MTQPSSDAMVPGPSTVRPPDEPLAALARRKRQIQVLQAQLRQQGAVIDEYRLKLRHATERAEADERLLAEQAGLLVKLSRDLKGAVEQLRAIMEEAGEDIVRVGTLVRYGDRIVVVEKIERDERNIVMLTIRDTGERPFGNSPSIPA